MSGLLSGSSLDQLSEMVRRIQERRSSEASRLVVVPGSSSERRIPPRVVLEIRSLEAEIPVVVALPSFEAILERSLSVDISPEEKANRDAVLD